MAPFGAQVPKLPPPHLPLPFLVLCLVSTASVLVTLLFLLLARDSAHPALVSFLLSYLVYLVGMSLVVLQQGGHMNQFPEFPICLLQGAMMVSGSPTICLSTFSYIFFVWGCTQEVSKRARSFLISRAGTLVLVLVPWTVYAFLFGCSLVVGLRNHQNVWLQELYCIVYELPLSRARFFTTLGGLILTLVFSIATSYEMFKKYGTEARRAANKLTFQSDVLMFVESCGITMYLLVLAAMIVSAIGRKTGTQADLTAATGGIFTLLLAGAQIGIFSSSQWRTSVFTFQQTILSWQDRLSDYVPFVQPPRRIAADRITPTAALQGSDMDLRRMDEGDGGSFASSPKPGSSFGDLSLPPTSVDVLGELERGGDAIVLRLGYEERRKKIEVDVEVVALNEPAADLLPPGKRVYI